MDIHKIQTKTEVCMNLNNIFKPVSEPLGCYLVPVLVFSKVVSSELDPPSLTVTRV